MKIHQLMALITIADTGSVRSAARALNVSPAAVTKSVHELEDCLQLALFTRTSSGVALTEGGRTLLVHARLVVRQLASAQEAIDAMRGTGTVRGRLSIAVTPWIAITVLPEAVSRFRRKMPNTRFEFFEGFLSIAIPRLRDGTLDLFVGRPTPGVPDIDLTYRPLLASSCAVVARQGHPLANAHSLADLCDLDWLLGWDPVRENDPPGNMFARAGLPVPRNVHLFNSLLIGFNLLRQTDMVSLFPWPLVEACAAKEGLCAIPVREQLEEACVGIISRGHQPVTAASECFADCLVDSIRDSTQSSSTETRRAIQSVELLI